ncbi:MAG: hypothetical protein WCP69_09460 [Bacteroidota bacterium]
MKSENKITIELLEEHEKVNFYTIQYDGETENEFIKFINQFAEQPKYKKDLLIIIAWIDKIATRGALERNFRTAESKMNDGVCAIPIETSKLRLYCLRISDEILIIGSGGIKNKKTYNEDSKLNDCVSILASLDKYIKTKKKTANISIIGKTITGDLSFVIKQNNITK